LKTAHDPRHIRRILAVKALFARSFHEEQAAESELANKVIKQIENIDQIITECAPEWPLSQINRLDLCVLELAVYELLNKKNTPPKVIIDEAIEIGKRYGSASSGSFINGVLASALKATKRGEDL
jgi:N utilization substance protein B